MNILADENIEKSVIDFLHESQNIISIAELKPGITDHEVAELANNSNAILLTEDKDFGEIVFRQKMIKSGVILLRLHGQPTQIKINILRELLANHSLEIFGSFTVVTTNGIRIRKF
jgi:predicted nuclease of predicted toxin-antitoxin system